MIILLKKVIYLFLTAAVNLYLCSYFINKISARSELRRGFVARKTGGLGYPFLKLFKYLAKDYSLNIWEILLFFFSFFIWTIIPFSQGLAIIKFDSDLIIALLFYIILVFLILVNASRSSHNYIFSNITRRILMVLMFLIPMLFSISSIVLINRTLTFKEIIGFQYQYWNIIYQPLGFIVFFTSAFLQLKLLGLTGKNLFLFSENSEKEVEGFGRLTSRVAGYSALFFLIAMMTILYLAGWQNLFVVNGNILFAVKFYLIFFLLLLVDKATPRLDDYSYLLSINWRFLMPVSAVNFLLTIVFFILRNIYNLV